MGAGSALRDAYYSLEDKWYSFVDSIGEKVPAFSGFIDGLEDKGIPTFPAFIVLIVIIIALLAYFFIFATGSALTINVTDSQGNAVESATVLIMSGTEEKAIIETNSDGAAIFFLPNGEYTIKIDKDGYSSTTQSLILQGETSEDMTLSLIDSTLTKSVYLKNASGALIGGSGTLIYKCKNGTEEQTATYANGKFEAKVNASCAEVEVLSMQNYNLVTNTASFSGNSAVTVEEIVVLKGSASVTLSIAGTSEIPTAGLRVKLIPNDGTAAIEEISTGTSIVSFEAVPIKSYYVAITDPQGLFEAYDGSKTNDTKEVKQSQLTQFNAVLTKSTSSKITVTVKDAATNSLVKGADITITSLTSATDTQTKTTDVTGQKEFAVAAGSAYTISVEHSAYINGVTKQATAGDTVEILLTKADETNSDSILVKVVDPKGEPIENARVILKKTESGEQVVGEKTTGASGSAEFFNLDITKTYFATVSKEGFGSQNSTSISAQPRTQKVLQVTFNIGDGRIAVKVLDTEKNPLSGAAVKAINYFTSQQEGSSILTNAEGSAEFTIRADKKVYFVVETSGYSKYFTAATQPTANALIEKQVVLQKASSKLVTTLVGVYSGADEVVNSSTTQAPVSSGIYTVKAVVQVPKGSFTEAGIHLRTGKETQNVTNNLEEDGLFLSKVESSGRITKGTTYTPPQGRDYDLKNTTAGNAKWANSVWKNPSEGTYEVEAEITVNEENANIPLNLFYRGWAKGSTTLKDPIGDTTGQELYWPAKNRVLTSGSSNLCSASFCKSYLLETLSGSEAGKKRIVLGSVEAKKGVSYSLTADLTNYSGKAIGGAVLNVDGKSLDINSVIVNGAEQTNLSAINLGTIGIDAPIKVVVIFTTVSSGTASVKLTINSSKATELDEAINFNVKVNKKFTFNMLPKVVVPYIDNTLFFEALDGNSMLNGVRVSIKSGEDLLDTVETNGEGLAKYILSEPRIGDVLTITAQKEGYDPVTVTKKVDSALLSVVPTTVTETIKVGVIKSIDEMIVLQNNTPKDIKITSVTINGDVKQYVDIKFIDTINGTVIAQGADRNYSLSMKLNSAAMRIAEPKDLSGTIVFNTEVANANQDYLTELPIAIRLSLPGYLDTAKCLKSDTTTIEFVASDSEQSKTITLTNACEAESTPVTLHNIAAKLNEDVKIGTVSVSGTGFKNVQLNTKYNDIADTIDASSESQLTIRFSPNPAVASGTQAFTITLAGQNVLNDNTTEKVETAIKVNSTTTFLSKCVEIQKPIAGLLIDVAPWNTGYNRILASSYSSTLNSYGGFSNQSSPYNMSYMAGMGMGGYGSSGYGAGYGNSFNGYGNTIGGIGGTSNLGQPTGMEQNSFIIKNNCLTDIDVQLEADSRISVAEEKFTISSDSDYRVTVQPGYVFGKYNIKVNAKPSNSLSTKKNLGNVPVIVRRLGDIDKDCIKTNVTTLNLNSFTYTPQKYSVYNYCYDQGAQLSRSNIASIECSAPMNQYDLGFFQTDQSQYYGSQFPLNAQNPTYNSYVRQSQLTPNMIQSNGCAVGRCSLITGTRVRYRTIEEGANGSVERVDFEVMPSAQYIPQMKLFDAQRNSYGAFQNLSAIRQWGTETAARTDVYGNLNISYTNQYGSAQCMEFPITISDTWRMLESVDSAINWGDPNARPKDCQETTALDITDYWKRTDSSANGAIPNAKFVKGKYLYLPEPPALRIGPSPTQQSQQYPVYNMQYYMNQSSNYNLANDKQNTANASKNCGIMDNIDVKTQIDPKEVGGARITVTDMGSGSILNNTRGANLGVEIDNTNMTVNCVVLDRKPITAKVTRAITLQSQELTWPLSVIITKPGYIYQGNPSECMRAVGSDIPVVVQPPVLGCTGTSAEYGYDLIGKTKASLAKNDVINCATSFCNNDMLQAFLLNKFADIKEAMSGFTATGTASERTLTQLYKQAATLDVNLCNDGSVKFFTKENKTLDFNKYQFTKEMLTGAADFNKTINEMGPTAIQDMIAVLDKIPAKDVNKVLLEIDANTAYNSELEILGARRVTDSGKYYLSLANYKALLKDAIDSANVNLYDSALTGIEYRITDTTFDKVCRIIGTVDTRTFKWMSYNSRLVIGIIDNSSITEAEKEMVYAANSRLNNIHKLAKFSTAAQKLNTSGLTGNLFTTAIPQITAIAKNGFLGTVPDRISNLTLDFKTKNNTQTLAVGNYAMEIDYNFANASENKATIIVGDNDVVALPKKAAQNPLLTSGYVVTNVPSERIMQNPTQGTILATNGTNVDFYQRVPVKLTVQLPQNETNFNYGLLTSTAITPVSLINWYASNGNKAGVEAKTQSGYALTLAQAAAGQTVKGLFYYPGKDVQLVALSNLNGGTISATLETTAGAHTVLINNEQLPKQLDAKKLFELSATINPSQQFTLDTLLEEVKAGNVCPIDNGAIWNEKKIVGN